MQVQPGSILGGHTVVQPLGAGSAGTMFLARRPGGIGDIPIEVMPAEWAAIPAIRAAVEQAARPTPADDHPAVATVTACGTSADPVLWLALRPLPAGATVTAVGRRPARMDPARVIRIAGELAGALDHAHQRGVLHGNVSPAAVLLQRDTTTERALLSGFGLARRLEPAGAGAVADLGCAAPERWTPGSVLDHHADVYSLGCTLFQLLTGVPVVSGDEPGSVGAAHRYAPAPSVRDLRPELPVGLDAVIATALAKDPADRYSTCGQLAAAARQALGAGAIAVAAADPVAPQALSFAAAHPRSAAQQSGGPPDAATPADSGTAGGSETEGTRASDVASGTAAAGPVSDATKASGTEPDSASETDTARAQSVSSPPGKGRGKKIAVISAAAGTAIVVTAAAAFYFSATADHSSSAAPAAPATTTEPPATPPGPAALPAPKPRAATVDCSYHTTSAAAVPGITEPTTSGISTVGTAQVSLDTSAGPISLELNRSLAPCTVDSFLNLVSQNYFDNSPCHRFTTLETLKVLQCGDPTGKGTGNPGYEFGNEYPSDQLAPDDPNAAATVRYPRGTVAMANGDLPGTPSTGTDGSQFFLVYGDSELPPNYTVFGTVDPAGLATLDKIAAAGTADGSQDGAPADPVTVATVHAE